MLLLFVSQAKSRELSIRSNHKSRPPAFCSLRILSFITSSWKLFHVTLLLKHHVNKIQMTRFSIFFAPVFNNVTLDLPDPSDSNRRGKIFFFCGHQNHFLYLIKSFYYSMLKNVKMRRFLTIKTRESESFVHAGSWCKLLQGIWRIEGRPQEQSERKIDLKSKINYFKKSGGRNQQWERDNKFYNSHSWWPDPYLRKLSRWR